MRTVSLNQLTHSESFNARKTNRDKNVDHYEVIAGGRRLILAKRIPIDMVTP